MEVKADNIPVRYLFSHHTNRYTLNMPHMHDRVEIFIHISGLTSCFIQNAVFHVPPRSVILLDSNEIHQMHLAENEPYERYMLLYQPEYFRSRYPEFEQLCSLVRGFCQSQKYIFPLSARQVHEIGQFYEAYESKGDFCKNMVQEAVFLNALTTLLFTLKTDEAPPAARIAPPDAVTQIFKELDEHYAAPSYDLDTLARNLNYNKSYLCTVFKQHTGMTIWAYLNEKKMSEAKKMLLSGASITACCEALGYADYNSFIRRFKKTAGVSPMRYSRLHKTT